MAGNERHGPVLDQNILKSVVEMIGADEPAIMLDLIDTYLLDSQRQVDELENWLNSGDYKTLHRMAHSLKSSSATFGATTLSKLCESLERLAKADCADGTCADKVEAVRAEHSAVVEALQGERIHFGG